MLSQKTEETVLSLQRVSCGEQVRLLSLTESDSRIVMWLQKGVSKQRRDCKAVLCNTALRVQLRTIGVCLECFFLEILALALSWQPRRDCDSQRCSRLYQTLSNTMWALNSRDPLKGYNLHSRSNPEKPPAAALVPRTSFSRAIGCLKIQVVRSQHWFLGGVTGTWAHSMENGKQRMLHRSNTRQ